MPVDFSSLLADTLKARGFEVEDASPLDGASGASYPVTLLARRGDDEYLVDALASRTVHEEDLQALASIVDDAGLDGAIVMALEGAQVSQTFEIDRVEVWDRGDIDEAVGSYVVDRHLEEGIDIDEIGPSPVSPEIENPPQAEATPAPDPAREPIEPPASHSEPEPEPEAEPEPELEGEPEPPAQVASAPDGTPPASPEAPTASADAEEETEALDDVDHRDLVDPEDMLERAERLMQEGTVDDGDAELLVEEENPTDPPSSQTPADPSPEDSPPTSEPAEPTPEQSGASAEPEPMESTAPEGSDAELLESEPETSESTPAESKRPQPEGQPPEPEPASTARGEEDEPEPSTGEEEEPAAPESPAAVAGPGDEAATFVSGATIEPRVQEDEARIKAEEALFDVDESRLELLPFHVYEYDAVLEGDGHRQPEQGRVWVSTQSGAVVRAPRGDRVNEPEVAHERFQGSLSGPETEQAAREHLLDSLERRDEVRQDYSEAAVIERVRLEPEPESLELELLGKAFAPRWRVVGQNGTVFVDAVTGELVNE